MSFVVVFAAHLEIFITKTMVLALPCDRIEAGQTSILESDVKFVLSIRLTEFIHSCGDKVVISIAEGDSFFFLPDRFRRCYLTIRAIVSFS